MSHTETRQKLKERIVTKEDGVSPKYLSHSPVIEVGGERDTSTNSSDTDSMTEFREVKSIVDDLRVELEVKNQPDKDVSHSTPVIEVGRQRNMSINNSAATSMTEFVKSTEENLGVGLEVKTQFDKDRTSEL